MAWLAVDKNGDEKIFKKRPKRVYDGQGTSFKIKEYWKDVDSCMPMSCTINFLEIPDYSFVLPKGSIKKLIGRELTWKDEPVELKD